MISEALPNDATQRAVGAGHGVNAKLDAVAVAEIELREIAMLLLAVLIDALHAALENRVVAFDGIGVGVEAGFAVRVAVFFAAMLDGPMARITVTLELR